MKYHIPGTYHYDNSRNLPLVTYWRTNRYAGKSFRELIKDLSGSDQVYGNWEDGWTIEFDDEAKYIWFLLRWG